MVQGLIHDIPTCKELVTRMVSEAEAIIASRLNRMSGMVGAKAAE
jgi:nitronate monooxygenase